MNVWNNGFNFIAYLIVMIILFPAADAYIYLFMGHAASAASAAGRKTMAKKGENEETMENKSWTDDRSDVY